MEAVCCLVFCQKAGFGIVQNPWNSILAKLWFIVLSSSEICFSYFDLTNAKMIWSLCIDQDCFGLNLCPFRTGPLGTTFTKDSQKLFEVMRILSKEQIAGRTLRSFGSGLFKSWRVLSWNVDCPFPPTDTAWLTFFHQLVLSFKTCLKIFYQQYKSNWIIG